MISHVNKMYNAISEVLKKSQIYKDRNMIWSRRFRDTNGSEFPFANIRE